MTTDADVLEFQLTDWRGFNDGEARQLACPACQFEYVHFGAAENKSGPEYSCPIGCRTGSWIEIEMWCEGGHIWTLVIGFHKGATMIACVNVREGDGWDT